MKSSIIGTLTIILVFVTAIFSVAVYMDTAWAADPALPSPEEGDLPPDVVVEPDVPEPVPPSLKTVKVPMPPHLEDFIEDKDAAIRLGKALFWDMQIGSDGQACASCHFHAGADNRTKNQLTPALTRVDKPELNAIFGNNPFTGTFDFPQFAPDYNLTQADFPLHLLEDVDDQNSCVLRDTDDKVSSQGVFNARFVKVVDYNPLDVGIGLKDDIFRVGDLINVRRVEPRNTPTAINAVFNFANFWDGRANFFFNGNNPFGALDQDSTIFVRMVVNGEEKLVKRKVRVPVSSLASQADGPPLSNFEMSFDGRTFPDIGKKMLTLTPLGLQMVHPDDSVLGKLSRAKLSDDYYKELKGDPGLMKSYPEMIMEAFKSPYWDSTKIIRFDKSKATSFKGDSSNPRSIMLDAGEASISDMPEGRFWWEPDEFTQMEANFSLFFGLAVQLYEATLVADDSKFDQFREGKAYFTSEEQKGLDVFMDKGKCIQCHGGSEFTNASITRAQVDFNDLADCNCNDCIETCREDEYGNKYDCEFLDRNGNACDPTPNRERLGCRKYCQYDEWGNEYDCKWELPNGKPCDCNLPGHTANELIELMLMGNNKFAIYDNGFYNIGVRPTGEDLGRGGDSPFINPITGDPFPLSFVKLAALKEQGKLPPDVAKFVPRFFKNVPPNFRKAVDGAFKTPGLRNVELTGPYFHTGGELTLKQVVQFYDRGGNFKQLNIKNLDPDIDELDLTEEEKDNLVSFLLTLTDQRVKFEKAPFDHPEIFVAGDGTALPHTGDRDAFKDNPCFLQKKASGKNGLDKPLDNFLGISSMPKLGPNNDHFDGGPRKYDDMAIKGKIVDSSGAPMSGVTLTMSGGATSSALTDFEGNYSFTDLVDGSYAVTPTMAKFNFTPSSKDVVVDGSDKESEDFYGEEEPTFAIYGKVTDSTGTGVAGVNITLSGDADAVVSTDSAGNYAFAEVEEGDYVVTPTLTDTEFEPASLAVKVNGANKPGQNFEFANDPPVATGDTFTASATKPLIVAAPGVLGNDTDADGDTLSAVLVSGTTNGTLVLNANGSFSYTNPTDVVDPVLDTFAYKVSDGTVESEIVSVTITVNPRISALGGPVAVDDTAIFKKKTVKVKLLKNDVVGEEKLDKKSVAIVTPPANGTVTVSRTGTATYTPALGFAGVDTFAYTVKDVDGVLSNVALVTVSVPGTAPLAVADAATTHSPATVRLLKNDTDTDRDIDKKSVQIVTPPSNGTVTVGKTGTAKYVPNAGFTGVDTFTYTVMDKRGLTSNVATVAVTVQ